MATKNYGLPASCSADSQSSCSTKSIGTVAGPANDSDGGTTFAQWDPSTAGTLFGRIRTAILRCRARGLEPDAIFWGQGGTDGQLGTAAGAITQSIRNIVDAMRAAPLACNAPFYVGQYTMVGGITSAAVRAGIANAVDVARSIKLGYDADTNLTVAGGFRLADGAHAGDTGLATSATAWTTLAYP